MFSDVFYLRTALVVSVIFVLGNMLAFLTPEYYKINELELYRESISKPVQDRDIEYLLDMYSGRPSYDFLVQRTIRRVMFEDPCMIGEGGFEIFKAFRALNIIKPQMLHFLIISHTDASLQIYLYMHYIIWSMDLRIDSILYVEYNEENLISSIREQWNDMPLYTNLLSRLIRRINGLLIYYLSD